MLRSKFGIEIEFTGITRNEAAKIVGQHFGKEAIKIGGYYDKYQITTADGRDWTIMSDASISTQRKVNGRVENANSGIYSVELVSPILTYREDIQNLQELIRKLRKAGAITNNSTGIHIHLDGSNHTPRSIKNFINIIASKNDLLYKSLQIKQARMHYCKKMDDILVKKIKEKNPQNLEQIKAIWYDGYYGSTNSHYHESRYHFLNLHSFFTGNHTQSYGGTSGI